MVRLLWMAALATAMLLADAGPTRARAPPPAGRLSEPAIQGLERLSPEEQEIARRNLERWRALPPAERQRVIENYRHWKALSPDERKAARQNQERLGQPAPAR